MAIPEQAALLRLYTDEHAKIGAAPLYEAIVQQARTSGLAGATVLRGPIGYGDSHRIHAAGIVSGNLPIVIEIVDAEDKLLGFLASLGDLADLGLVTFERLEVLHHKAQGPAGSSLAISSSETVR